VFGNNLNSSGYLISIIYKSNLSDIQTERFISVNFNSNCRFYFNAYLVVNAVKTFVFVVGLRKKGLPMGLKIAPS